MPEQVDRWLRGRDSGDLDLRTLIDRQILRTAQRVFGRERMVLSLPPKKRAQGRLHVGTILYENEKWPLGLDPGELLQGVTIFGRAGSGKTNLLFSLMRQLRDVGAVYTFVDWKRTGRHALSLFPTPVTVYTPGRDINPFPLNPFLPPPGLEPHLYITHVVDILASAYTLGDGSKSIVQRALASLHERGIIGPSIDTVLSEIEQLPGASRVRDWKVSAARALEGLRFTDLGGTEDTSQQAMVRDLLQTDSIIELNGLASNAKKFFVPILFLWMYYVRLGSAQRERLSNVVCIDEAHNILGRRSPTAGETVIEALLRQCRELGMGWIAADQTPSAMSRSVIANSYASVMMNLKQTQDVAVAASLAGLEGQEKELLRGLPVGEAIVRLQDRWNQPVRVRIPLLPIAKGAMTDAVLRGISSGRLSRTGRSGVDSPPEGGFRRDSGVDRVPMSGYHPSEREWLLLEDVVAYPDDGVRARYSRLGWSCGVGHRTKQRLLFRGWLEQAIVPVGFTRRVILRLSRAAMTMLGKQSMKNRGSRSSSPSYAVNTRSNPNTSGGESLVHGYFKRQAARELQAAEFAVEMEVPVAAGRADVLASRRGKRVIVEVETGQSDAVGNVRRALRANVDQVIVLATSERALTKLEQRLGSAGLLLPGRVRVIHGLGDILLDIP